MVNMVLKKISKYSLLCFIAAFLFVVAAIGKTLSGDSSLLIIAMTWFCAVAFAIIGFRELVRKTKS
jgi:lipopolysaccharide export LptBFGC system permease protein LptF